MMSLIDIPEEIIELIIKQSSILVNNNIPYKFPFTKFLEINLMILTNKKFHKKYHIMYKSQGHYIDTSKNIIYQKNVTHNICTCM